MWSHRFVDGALSELQNANRSAIYGFQHLPLLSLEDSVKKIVPFVPELTTYVPLCKRNCNRNSKILSLDESAAIYLYTMPTTFFSTLNEKLRDENREVLKPWFPYLRLFIHALAKLPSKKGIVWRGVRGDVGNTFLENQVHNWWSVNSCSTALAVIEMYLGETGTIFAINAIDAKDVSDFSTFPQEKEALLMPGSRVLVKSNRLSFKNALFIVHLKEKYPPDFTATGSDEPDDNNNLVPSWKLSTSKDDRFENSLTTLVNSDKNNDVNETNGNKNSSSTSVEAKKESSIQPSINLRCVTERPFMARELPSAVTYSISTLISTNDQFILLCGRDNLHIFNEELKLVRSTNNDLVSSHDLLDMVWCETISRFFVLKKDKAYILDPNIMQLSLIESIRLDKDDKEFTCCTCSTDFFMIGVRASGDRSCVYQYTLPDMALVTRLLLADLIGLDPPVETNRSSYCRSSSKIERDKDDRKIITLRFNHGRLGIIIEFNSNVFLYCVDFNQKPYRISNTSLASSKSRLVSVEKSREWLVTDDQYSSKILQISLDCQLKSEWASKEYSQSSFFTFSTGFVNLKGGVNNAIMFGPSMLLLLLDQSLALYKI